MEMQISVRFFVYDASLLQLLIFIFLVLRSVSGWPYDSQSLKIFVCTYLYYVGFKPNGTNLGKLKEILQSNQRFVCQVCQLPTCFSFCRPTLFLQKLCVFVSQQGLVIRHHFSLFRNLYTRIYFMSHFFCSYSLGAFHFSQLSFKHSFKVSMELILHQTEGA